jgi:hypothetical protein
MGGKTEMKKGNINPILHNIGWKDLINSGAGCGCVNKTLQISYETTFC